MVTCYRLAANEYCCELTVCMAYTALEESALLNNELGLTPAEELDSLGEYLTDGGGVWLDDPVARFFIIF